MKLIKMLNLATKHGANVSHCVNFGIKDIFHCEYEWLEQNMIYMTGMYNETFHFHVVIVGNGENEK